MAPGTGGKEGDGKQDNAESRRQERVDEAGAPFRAVDVHGKEAGAAVLVGMVVVCVLWGWNGRAGVERREAGRGWATLRKRSPLRA